MKKIATNCAYVLTYFDVCTYKFFTLNYKLFLTPAFILLYYIFAKKCFILVNLNGFIQTFTKLWQCFLLILLFVLVICVMLFSVDSVVGKSEKNKVLPHIMWCIMCIRFMKLFVDFRSATWSVFYNFFLRCQYPTSEVANRVLKVLPFQLFSTFSFSWSKVYAIKPVKVIYILYKLSSMVPEFRSFVFCWLVKCAGPGFEMFDDIIYTLSW